MQREFSLIHFECSVYSVDFVIFCYLPKLQSKLLVQCTLFKINVKSGLPISVWGFKLYTHHTHYRRVVILHVFFSCMHMISVRNPHGAGAAIDNRVQPNTPVLVNPPPQITNSNPAYNQPLPVNPVGWSDSAQPSILYLDGSGIRVNLPGIYRIITTLHKVGVVK